MRSRIRAALLAGAIAVGFCPAVLQPAVAQGYVSFDYFHDHLAGYGAWLYSDRWGTVWQPEDVPDNFRPYYTDGHWVYTSDYGWMWDSEYDWGDIPFHYGRWVNDPDDGWLWIPGYTWAPSWVVWRTNNAYVGWMPMPPDPAFIEGAGLSIGGGGVSISFGWNNDPYYGYRRWYGGDYDDRRFASNWVFVGYGHVADRDYGRYAVHDPAQTINIVHQTTMVVNYTVVNNYVVNRGVDVHRVEQAAHRPIAVMPAREVIRRPNLIASVAAGQRARELARAIAPVGHGMANSAPPPPPQVVQRLSNRPPMARGGRPPMHLFAKAEVSNPAMVASHFHGKPAPGPQTRPDNIHPDIGHPGNPHPENAHPAPAGLTPYAGKVRTSNRPPENAGRGDRPETDNPHTRNDGAPPSGGMMMRPQTHPEPPRGDDGMPERHMPMSRPESGRRGEMVPESRMRPPRSEMEQRGFTGERYPGGPGGGSPMAARAPHGGMPEMPNRGPAVHPQGGPAPAQARHEAPGGNRAPEHGKPKPEEPPPPR
jgi:hypothetical protein